jgi:hypothetical protein
MSDDFTLIDFALCAAPPARVCQALGQAHALRAARAQAAPGARRGLLSRLLGRGGAGRPAPLLLQQPGHLPAPPLMRFMPDDLGFGAGETPARLTAPVGEAALTLLEFRETDGETSPLCEALSGELPGAEIFYFRLSGARHPGAETAFHVYLDGRAVRRSASISPEGTTPEAEWRVVDTGIPHAVEADSLPHARARAWEIMTPERQGAILGAMGVEADLLFDPAARPPPGGQIVVELSAEPGGRPLSDAVAHLSRDPAREGRDGRAAPAGPAAPGPSGAPAPASAGAPPAPEAAEAASHAAGPAAGPDVSQGGAPGPEAGAGAPQPGDPEGWEAEVTRLLVAAVSHALPEEQQVPWLTRLTRKLETGEVESALAEARALIARGDRPKAEREADAARLDALFGVGGDPPQR